KHPIAGAATSGGHSKPVPGHQWRGTAARRNRTICPAAEGTEGGRRADIAGADLLRGAAHVARRMRASAVEDAVADCANRAPGDGSEGGGFLSPESKSRLRSPAFYRTICFAPPKPEIRDARPELNRG